jgi:uroporphyrin-III C-methyltransferase/precorrin-2 dehydrogenase/sirohydrochlorin ferrochelatase
LRKVEGLLSEGAEVTVVATAPIQSLEQLAESGDIQLRKRSYQKGELDGYALGFAATDDRDVNQQVYEDGEAARIWVNVADEPDICSFHLPARLKRGAFQLVVASAGEAPFVVRRLRQLLEKRFGLEWGEWMRAAARFREAVRSLGLSPDEREERYDRFFWETVDKDSLSARVPSAEEEAEWLTPSATPEGRAQVARHIAHDIVDKTSETQGFVSLVGGGPGDPGLLTVKGKKRLMAADAVVYDHLAETALPCDLPPTAELHSVGKKAGSHPIPQDEINTLLIRLAKEGKNVVRLKGGDPYVFGRGGEEAEALTAAGIGFEVVPSVTAAVAVPAYAGIPVTHRKEVVRVTLVTAHESAKKGGPQVRWDLLASDKHSMILGYMGVTALPNVVRDLLAYGMDPKTPAAMVERGTTSCQRVARSTLSELPQTVEKEGIQPPALFAIGPAVRFADQLEWFQKRPLFGERLVVATSGVELKDMLELNGADVVEISLPVSPAARIVLGALPLSGCVFGSPDEVEALDDERDGAGWSPEMVAWCLNEATAHRAKDLGWRHVETVEGSPSELVTAMGRKGSSR